MGDEIADRSEQRGAAEERVHGLGDDGFDRDHYGTDRPGRLTQRGEQGVHRGGRQVGAHPRVEHELLVGGSDEGAQRIGDNGQEVGHVGGSDRGDLRDAGVALPQQSGGDQLAGVRCQGRGFQRRGGHEIRCDLAEYDVDGARQGGADLHLDRRAAEEDLESGQHAVVQQIGDGFREAALPDEEADPLDNPRRRERRNLGEHRVGQPLLDDRVAEGLLDEIRHGVADSRTQSGGGLPLRRQQGGDLVGDERQERGVVDEFIEGRDDARPVPDHHVEQDVVADVPDQGKNIRRQHDRRGTRDERLDGGGDLALEELDGCGDHVAGVRIRGSGGRQRHVHADLFGSGSIDSGAAEQRPCGTTGAGCTPVRGSQRGGAAHPSVAAVSTDEAAGAAVTTRPAGLHADAAVTTVTTGAEQSGITAGTAVPARATGDPAAAAGSARARRTAR